LRQKKSDILVNINGRQIEKVENFKYLGVWINDKMSNKVHIKNRLDKFNKGIYAIGGSGITSNRIGAWLKSFILRTYCLSIFLYGVENLPLSWYEICSIKSAYTVALKRCLMLNKLLKTEELCYACNMEPIQIEIIKKKIILYKQLMMNKITKDVALTMIEDHKNNSNNKLMHKFFIIDYCMIIDTDYEQNSITNKTREVEIKLNVFNANFI
jgi:hypothetical protein